MRLETLRDKEVINICNCKRLGYVYDVEFDMCSGCLTAILIPGPGHFCGLLGRSCEYRIPICKIRQVGDELILVDISEEECLIKI